MTLKTKPPVRYSDEFKSRILTLVEARELTIRQISKDYGINSNATIYRWMKAAVAAEDCVTFGPKAIMPKPPIVQAAIDIEQENRELKAEIASLRELFHQEILRSESYLTLIKLRDGSKINASKKNAGSKPLKP